MAAIQVSLPQPGVTAMSAQDVLVVGAGVMGIGIAQVAAQAGHRVFVFDQREGAAEQACKQLAEVLTRLVNKGKITPAEADATLGRLVPAASLQDAASANLAIEAIVEKLEPKRALLRELEALLPVDALLASNTSSISITALAAGLQHPERVVGMHFFNPVPLMALVEVVSGLRTPAEVAQRIERLARAWGKVAVQARSTPGFIVNRIARPYYAEALMLLQEQAARPEVLDALLRAAGFRMGPCELMDLIGHDTNFAVTQSVFEANFFDRRFTPSLVQRELVEGGLLGRKSGRGFYAYPEGAPVVAAPKQPPPDGGKGVTIHGTGAVAQTLLVAARMALNGPEPATSPESDWIGIAIGSRQLRLTDGRPAWQVARDTGVADIAVFDELPGQPGGALAYAQTGSPAWRAEAPSWLQAFGWHPHEVADAPGLVVARTLAMLVNEAADAVHQGVCSPSGADAAMKLGVNYPAGPFEWLERLGPQRIVSVLEALDQCYRGERYRVSPLLQRA
ncbi:3-hydroxyacyl-CoA dehydrogenase [Ramlibacter sp. WS9]|uniref:3-hydroxyacyl-CoA dehydrogenase n=1 Tax=Ramlibacter sp. WS9 TaxID=1882741 RepID=UPI0011447DE7|nr:3-hydroxyacyl-CoA dehydrogenase [Ramlibacter sp. WS9]ROZ74359.1 3-hydroxyacyl-CoA dehydrogenase [Ramlibacter sp. WS9]